MGQLDITQFNTKGITWIIWWKCDSRVWCWALKSTGRHTGIPLSPLEPSAPGCPGPPASPCRQYICVMIKYANLENVKKIQTSNTRKQAVNSLSPLEVLLAREAHPHSGEKTQASKSVVITSVFLTKMKSPVPLVQACQENHLLRALPWAPAETQDYNLDVTLPKKHTNKKNWIWQKRLPGSVRGVENMSHNTYVNRALFF